jgi:hypothetical protein
LLAAVRTVLCPLLLQRPTEFFCQCSLLLVLKVNKLLAPKTGVGNEVYLFSHTSGFGSNAFIGRLFSAFIYFGMMTVKR